MKLTVPVKPVVLPNMSWAVTLKLWLTPAVVLEGKWLTAKWFVAAALTEIPDWLPLMPPLAVSVAVSDWLPAVLSVALKVCWPESVAVNV